MNDNVLDDINSSKKETLKVKTKFIDDVDFCVIVYLYGYIDAHNVNNLQLEIDKCISEGIINFIFDFEDINHITSQAIGIFTDLKDSIKQYKGSVAFYGLSGNVLDIFSMLGFYDYFIVTNDVYEAIDEILTQDHTEEKQVVQYYPKSFNCPICNVKLKAKKAGIFNCSGCKTRLALGPKGEVSLV